MEAQPKEASSTRSVGRKSHADAYARPAKQTAGSFSDFREAPFVRVSTIPMHQLKPLSPFFVSGLAPNEWRAVLRPSRQATGRPSRLLHPRAQRCRQRRNPLGPFARAAIDIAIANHVRGYSSLGPPHGTNSSPPFVTWPVANGRLFAWNCGREGSPSAASLAPAKVGGAWLRATASVHASANLSRAQRVT